MFTILHRLRGTWSWMAKVVGLIVGILIFLCTLNPTAGILGIIAYVLGESFGWGKWVGGIIKGYCYATEKDLKDKTGKSWGVHYIANFVFNEKKYFQEYCYLALILRGLVYWIPLFLVLYFLILFLLIYLFFQYLYYLCFSQYLL